MIAPLEKNVGRRTGAARKRDHRLPGSGPPGPLDSLDASIQTRTRRLMLVNAGLSRSAAVLGEIGSRERCGFDAWLPDNAEPPSSETLEAWRAVSRSWTIRRAAHSE